MLKPLQEKSEWFGLDSGCFGPELSGFLLDTQPSWGVCFCSQTGARKQAASEVRAQPRENLGGWPGWECHLDTLLRRQFQQGLYQMTLPLMVRGLVSRESAHWSRGFWPQAEKNMVASTRPLPAAVVTGKRQDAPSPLHSFSLPLTAMKIKPHLLPPHMASSFTDERAGLWIFSEWPGRGCTHPISRKKLEEWLCVSAGTRSKQAARLGSLSIRPEEVTYHPQAGCWALGQKSKSRQLRAPSSP